MSDRQKLLIEFPQWSTVMKGIVLIVAISVFLLTPIIMRAHEMWQDEHEKNADIFKYSDQGKGVMVVNSATVNFEEAFVEWRKDHPKRSGKIIGIAATQYSIIVLYKFK